MATSNETFGIMKPGEEIVIRCTRDGRGYMWFTRRATTTHAEGITGGTIPTTYTSAATLATAVQNALPTLES